MTGNEFRDGIIACLIELDRAGEYDALDVLKESLGTSSDTSKEFREAWIEAGLDIEELEDLEIE